MHVLICLSYLSKERFSLSIEETHFVDKISDFVELYSQLNPQAFAANNSLSQAHNGNISNHYIFLDSESAIAGGVAQGNEIDKKTVLDLCAHMFHPKDQSHDVSGTMEFNEMKQEERIRELENA